MSENLKFDPNTGILSVPTENGLLLGALQQNRGWLMEALHVEIMWNRIKSDE